LAAKAGKKKAQAKTKPRNLEWSPPQSELDTNIRNVLSQVTKHVGAITFELASIEEINKGLVCWDVAQLPTGKFEITLWWLDKEGGKDDE
jgi:hypothetical protein